MSEAATAATWLRPGRRADRPERAAVARLVCLPPAGGSASAFRAWQRGGGSGVLEVLAVQAPGRADRAAEPACTELRELAAGVAVALAATCDHDHRPLALFGHSMGALVAFELALALERDHGIVPSLLVVAAAAPPRTDVRGRARVALAGDLRARLVAEGGLPEHVLAQPGLLDVILPVVRADLAAVARYRADRRAAVSCPILALAGTRDPFATPALMAGWSRATNARVTVRAVRGGHHFVGDPSAGVQPLLEAAVLGTVAHAAAAA